MNTTPKPTDAASSPTGLADAPSCGSFVYCDLCHGVQPFAADSRAHFVAAQVTAAAASIIPLLLLS